MDPRVHGCRGQEARCARKILPRDVASFAAGSAPARWTAAPGNSMQAPDSLASNETLATIHCLRSIHGDFSERPLRDDQVETIITASVRAANASNMQSYSIIVSRDPVKIQKLTTYRSPCLLLYCADYNRLLDVAKHLGHNFYADNLEAFVSSSTNAVPAAQTAVIAGKSLGIDSLLTNGIHRGDLERAWSILGLPQRACFPLIALLLGYTKTEPACRMGRLRGPDVVHYETYRRATSSELDRLVARHDDGKSNLALNDAWRAKGHSHYLDWFYKEWVAGRKATTTEGPIFKRLKKSGYIDCQNS
jgi:nitroreductase